jgi:hypothetical protein
VALVAAPLPAENVISCSIVYILPPRRPLSNLTPPRACCCARYTRHLDTRAAPSTPPNPVYLIWCVPISDNSADRFAAYSVLHRNSLLRPPRRVLFTYCSDNAPASHAAALCACECLRLFDRLPAAAFGFWPCAAWRFFAACCFRPGTLRCSFLFSEKCPRRRRLSVCGLSRPSFSVPLFD